MRKVALLGILAVARLLSTSSWAYSGDPYYAYDDPSYDEYASPNDRYYGPSYGYRPSYDYRRSYGYGYRPTSRYCPSYGYRSSYAYGPSYRYPYRSSSSYGYRYDRSTCGSYDDRAYYKRLYYDGPRHRYRYSHGYSGPCD